MESMLSNSPMRLSRSWLAILFIFSVLSVGSYCNVFAASTINAQGKLTNKEGNPITGIQDLYFRLYNVSIATTPLWTEQHRINLGNDGLFNVRLGESASLDTLAFDKQLYLGISVNGENEMLPRQVLTSSPYALGSIGDFSVGKKLFVGGNARFSAVSEAWSEGIRIDVARNAWGGIRWYRGDANYNGNWGLGYKNDSTDDLVFTNNNGGAQYDRLVLTKSGNVGIGTASPGAKLSFGDLNDGRNTADGLTWFNPSPFHYGIYRSAGAWTAPNYQQLNLSWATGIVIDGGSAYGKSGTVLQPTGGNVGIGTVTPREKLEVNGNMMANGLNIGSSKTLKLKYYQTGGLGRGTHELGIQGTPVAFKWDPGGAGWEETWVELIVGDRGFQAERDGLGANIPGGILCKVNGGKAYVDFIEIWYLGLE